MESMESMDSMGSMEFMESLGIWGPDVVGYSQVKLLPQLATDIDEDGSDVDNNSRYATRTNIHTWVARVCRCTPEAEARMKKSH